MTNKRQITILLVLASFLLFACGLFEDEYDDYYEDETYDSEQYEDDEYDEEEEVYDDYEEDRSEELAELSANPELSIESIPEDAHPAFDVFSQYVDVFGIGIYASSDVSREKVLHAASVMAEYLDNDEDGQVDNPAVVRELVSRNAALFMFERPESHVENNFYDGIDDLFRDGPPALQPLYGNETFPDGMARGQFDPTLEEVLHLITNSGYAHAYPDIFGEQPGSAIADAMDEARGGYFEDVPSSYPAGAWYTYDDQTCDYACMISEYHYWALTSLLGAQDLPARGEEISHEWRLNTPEKLLEGDPAIYDLLTDPQYIHPSVLPDGDYNP
jgi:hypothetical protein